MPRKGWIKLHRGLLGNPIWETKPFDEGHAWVDLLLLAETEEKDVEIAGVQIHQIPGGVYWSKKDLMARWGWGRGRPTGAESAAPAWSRPHPGRDVGEVGGIRPSA